MIVVRLRGGLGNQMFQYAAGLALARRRRARLVLDLDRFERDPDHEGFVLDRAFGLREVAVRSAGTFLRRRVLRGPLAGRLITSESGTGSRVTHDPLLAAPRNCYVDGYWERECHFTDVAQELRELFRVDPTTLGSVAPLLRRIEDSESVAIHVRRGDMVVKPQFRSRLLDADHYRRAAERVLEVRPGASFFVFSDDPEWCRSELRIPAETTLPDPGERRPSWIDLELMRRCRHHIIANSTLSWWGAWLGGSSDQVVIAPSVESGSSATAGRCRKYPPSWISLP